MNIFHNIINIYNEDPIKFLMMIAIIYLIFNSMNINENFIPSNSILDINLNALNKVSELSNKWERAFSVDNSGKITFKKDITVNGKSEFDDNVKLKDHIKFRPSNDANTHTNGSYAIAANNPNATTKNFHITRRNTGGEWESSSLEIDNNRILTYDKNLLVGGILKANHFIKKSPLVGRNAKIGHGMAGHWGGWHPMKNCNANEYVCGMNAQVDPPDNDNSGMNGVKIKCCKM